LTSSNSSSKTSCKNLPGSFVGEDEGEDQFPSPERMT
jgi:hypothetical protein